MEPQVSPQAGAEARLRRRAAEVEARLRRPAEVAARPKPPSGTGTGPSPLAGIEGRLPPEIAAQAEADGVAKAGQDGVTLLALGVLGGAFISFGAVFATVALTGAEAAVPFGLARVAAG